MLPSNNKSKLHVDLLFSVNSVFSPFSRSSSSSSSSPLFILRETSKNFDQMEYPLTLLPGIAQSALSIVL